MIKFYYNYYKGFLKSYANAKNLGQHKSDSYSKVGLINPSIGSNNLGDIIIYDAVYKHLREIFPESFLTNYPSQLFRDYDSKVRMSEEDYLIVGGTNLLASNMDTRLQWKLDPLDKKFLTNKIVLMGTGWWQYQDEVNSYSKELFAKVLSKSYVHSVRDSYTEKMLKSAGIENVVNTTCPTLWELSPEHCATIPTGKAKNVITTLTFYHRDQKLDNRLLDILLANYEKVYMWVQAIEDIPYLKEISKESNRVILVPPTLEAYNSILDLPDIEYCGTRLHAGVRAVQKGKRTLIVAVDNRAIEIGKDTNLNVINRKDVELVNDFVKQPYNTDIKLPNETIDMWKKQFNAR